MKNPTVYRHAAELLFEFKPHLKLGCCGVICLACGFQVPANSLEYEMWFSEWFNGEHNKAVSRLAWWFENPVEGVEETPELRREARYLALLLCELITEEHNQAIQHESKDANP